MKKGFTLIEMIAVVIILALISLIALPNIINQLTEKKIEVSDATERMIFEATELYMQDRLNLYPREIPNYTSCNQTCYCVSLQELVNEGILEKPLKDFKTGTEISLNKRVQSKINAFGEYDEFKLVEASEC